ncbi:hypothetical protein PflQ2_3339 [Pseudomonas fluorescens Q2-87]|uniref:Uncharacterized protein n=1 Tax=Pseudomonas fluorescens (strain Q2-87) TaxID=1038922 RepID=J2F2B7_PSEFQ|nr:hypothetical protein [Pseudomonas fluorescens]EJL03098.1 hypothetical protein PflQ2_3339 [Pseudomonas fluorescens Q2-87]
MNVRSSSTSAVFYRCATATLFFLLGFPVSNAATESQENTPQPTSASVYANAIGDARFERSAIHVEQGYTIESGNLYARDGEAGSLVVVRSPDGAVVGIVNEPDKHGLLKVDPQGRLTFIAEPAEDLLENDTVKSQEDIGRPETASDGPSYIDMLFAYSANALNQLGVDPIAYALAQVEMVNLSLRNSRVGEVSLRLGAVSVFDVPHNTSDEGLTNWQNLLSSYRDRYKTDVNAAISAGTSQEQGRAYFRGYTSVSAWYATTTFAHEIGHNAGGEHCEEANGSDYNYGYNNGRTKTNMCTGSRSLYYSTPAVNDAYGLPIGSARTADMARVWRESTARLTGYRPELPGLRMMLVSSPGEQSEAYAELAVPGSSGREGAFVTFSPAVGPTELIPSSGSDAGTKINVKLRNARGDDVSVELWARRVRGDKCVSRMNAISGCTIYPLNLRLEYYPYGGNEALPAGYYNGFLQLEARRPNSDWKVPINIAISVKK